MTFLPVAQRELLAASRQRRTFLVRNAAGVLAVAVGFFGLLVDFATGTRSAGAPLFHFLTYTAAVVSALAGLLVTADAIASERRKGTLGFLFLTDLSSFDVLAGKLVAATAGAATALLAVFPVLAISMILGGVTAGEFWRHTFALVNLLWVAVCLGLCVSTGTRTAGRALFNGLILLLVLGVALPMLASEARQSGWLPALDWLWAVSPVEPLAHADHGFFATRPAPFWRALSVSHLLGWIFLGVAAWRLPRAWRNEAVGMFSRDAGQRRTPARLGNHRNPILALAPAATRERALVWSVIGLTLLAVGLGHLRGVSAWTAPMWGSNYFSPGLLVLRVVFAWHCCAFFQGLRNGAGELLLTTPLRERELVGGVWAAARAPVEKPFYLLVIAQVVTCLLAALVNVAGGWGRTLDALASLVMPGYVIASVIMDFVALAWLSLKFGLRSASPVVALGKCFAVLMLPRLLFCVPDLLISALVMTWARGYQGRKDQGGVRDMRIDPELGLRDAVRGD